jgi:broad specificity phosphatase PhoE
VALVVSSPLRRALQTSVHAFAPALQRSGVKVLLQPMAQEMNAYACDIGTDREELERQVKSGELWDTGLNVPSEKVDFGLVEEGWNSKVCFPQFEFTDADHVVGRQVGAGQSIGAETCC